MPCPLSQDASPRLRAPPIPNLLPNDPLSAPLGEVLALGDQTLVNGAGQQRDAVPADLMAEVLAGQAHGTRTGRTQDIHVQVLPLFCVGQRARSSHGVNASTPVLVATVGGVKCWSLWVGSAAACRVAALDCLRCCAPLIQ